MKVLGLKHRYREIGINMGLPIHEVTFGPGATMELEAIIQKLRRMGIDIHKWVLLRGQLEGERSLGTLVKAFKQLKVRTEVEVDRLFVTPTWFSDVERWVVYWGPNSPFNYGAMRPFRDMLIYDGDTEGLDNFLTKTGDIICLKAIVTKDPNEIWDLVKHADVRVYKKC